ncbi:uncharacterized protein L969DRAFT_56548 [Mixia osmundae IAM 14324]|uniref:Ribosomal protein L13 n=1 Tax=Mixia osmundae (strain CBS 9802 / IAM 14324 / JCM 22182 / KY 12970) TaxID=764103 RepID=G7E047_MIXOS|nr:uncharacterized protein L969DRAFT_56548 [Mixia osmundae IAM 14324]KEI42199.1 hypothetical protein L969DRAFT_56548 [Mixia osmundae IAM 14324]GAA96207.1 hypothetical protein E5Q_02871 [Mixia osmundae IAM 14324]
MSQFIGNTTLAWARSWHHISARDDVLGRTAARAALLLMGKHKPIWDPSVDCGDYVVVTDARGVVLTGRKAEQKEYYSHSMYPGGFKAVPFRRMLQRKPDEIIRKAVSGMLPKNKLRKRRLERLRIFPDAEHPHAANFIQRHTIADARPQSVVQRLLELKAQAPTAERIAAQ